MSIPQALESLRPGAEWTLIGDTLTWSDTSQTEPTTAEINAEVDRLEYSGKREEEYSALNQFELISDDAINGTTTHKDAIVAIKTKWPKDNSGPVE